LKEEALDRTMWRHRFGGGFGPVVRQNTEWMNENSNKTNSDLHLRKMGAGRNYNSETVIVWEEILRRIFGHIKENQICRIKTNEELDKLIKLKNIVNCIIAQRLSWFGHVQGMSDTRTVKKIFKWKPLTKRLQGRPSIDGRITLNRIFAKWRLKTG